MSPQCPSCGLLRRLLVMVTVLLISACQTPQVNHDYDVSTDFTQYQFWRWDTPALRYYPESDPRLPNDLIETRIKEASARILSQKGLEPASGSHPAQLLMRGAIVVEDRTDLQDTSYAGMPPMGWWGWSPYPYYPNSVRTYHYREMTLQIDFYDTKTQKLVWRGSSKAALTDSFPHTPQQYESLVNHTVTNILSIFPPD